VLWQDDCVVVVDKPAGWLVHNSAWAGPREDTVVDVARRQIAAGLVPVHRLDRGTSGALVDVDHALRDDEAPDAPARPARSRLVPVRRSDVERCSLVAVELLSGRRHQARRHCKHASHPIIGDASYGKGPLNRSYRERFGLARLALHCARLALPAAGVDVMAPLPADLRAPLALLFPGIDVDAVVAAAVGADAGA